VPAHCDLDLATDVGRIEIKGSIEGSINARTGVGSIRIKDVKGDVRARAAGGSINVDETKGSLDAETSTGEVVVRDSDGKFQIETSAGNIEIERASGQFQVSSSVGAIDFDGTVTEGEDNYLKTTVGSIDARLRQAIDIEIDAETDVGNVSISPHVKPVDEGEHHLLVRIGEATKRLRLRSETGSIRIIKGTEDKPAVETEKVETEKEDVKPEETEETDETEAEPLREEIK
jgi:hypothetical protein